MAALDGGPHAEVPPQDPPPRISQSRVGNPYIPSFFSVLKYWTILAFPFREGAPISLSFCFFLYFSPDLLFLWGRSKLHYKAGITSKAEQLKCLGQSNENICSLTAVKGILQIEQGGVRWGNCTFPLICIFVKFSLQCIKKP